LSAKAGKIEVESILNSKVDISEVETMMQTLEVKFEDEFQSIHESIVRRASAEDLAFYKQETSYKADKDDVESLRQDMFEKMSNV